ncbi:MAG: hypothetical protein A3G20_00285 [Acidobacteria bacterium RIFCSPLOWO2_12_FULL_59_11]|nr:MAG: hypothetical protein A3G20_00285 [Acidobacteria bacterium RIFCSPLOWO2_12_FULL_59_11]
MPGIKPGKTKAGLLRGSNFSLIVYGTDFCRRTNHHTVPSPLDDDIGAVTTRQSVTQTFWKANAGFEQKELGGEAGDLYRR